MLPLTELVIYFVSSGIQHNQEQNHYISLVHIGIRDNTLYTLTDHEKIVLFCENILNREHDLKQSIYH